MPGNDTAGRMSAVRLAVVALCLLSVSHTSSSSSTNIIGATTINTTAADGVAASSSTAEAGAAVRASDHTDGGPARLWRARREPQLLSEPMLDNDTTCTLIQSDGFAQGLPQHRCEFADILRGECDIPTYHGDATDDFAFVVTFSPNPSHKPIVTSVPDSQHNTTLRDALAAQTALAQLHIRGIVHAEDLEWLLDATWVGPTGVQVSGLVTNSLDLSIFVTVPSLLSLNLSDNGLIELTKIKQKRLPFSYNLKWLDLSKNLLSAIPADIFAGLENVHTLYLNHNILSSLSESTLNPLSALRVLGLRNNIITSLASGTFTGLSRLLILDLRSNRLSSLPEQLFAPLTELRILSISGNRYTPEDPEGGRTLDGDVIDGDDGAASATAAAATSDAPCPTTCDAPGPSSTSTFMSSGSLATLTQLCRLEMNELRLGSLPPDLFANTTSLRQLGLAGNKLATVQAHKFDTLHHLEVLALDRNRITCLPSGLFSHLTRLSVLGMSRNRLTCLPPDIFPQNAALRRLGLAQNRLHALAASVERTWANLTFLQLDENAFTEFDVALPALEALQLSDNINLRQLPNLSKLPQLRALRFANHRIGAIRMADFAVLSELKRLDLSRSEERSEETILVLEQATASSFPNLESFDVRNIRLDGEVADFFRGKHLALRELYMGSPRLDERVLPMDLVCGNLGQRVREFAILASGYTHVELCANHRFETVFLARNRGLKSIVSRGPLGHLDVAGCRSLTSLDVSFASTLDITNTRLPLLPELCYTLGARMLFARDMLSPSFRDAQAVALLAKRCLPKVAILDLSDNSWLRAFQLLGHMLKDEVVLSSDSYRTADLAAPVLSRANPPVFNLDHTPVSCRVALRTSRVRPSDESNGALTAELAYNFDCACSARFSSSGGQCKPQGLPNAAVAGIAVAGVFFGLMLGFGQLVLKWYRRHRDERREWRERDELHQQLISEKDREVMELKKAWEIEYADLDFIKRIDTTSVGTYGEVWKVRWDTLMVAVKVLKEGMMVMDEGTVTEFQKEVEFLQKTRHAHVVRFFGAGQTPQGAPFLVLELVALGSLRGILMKDLGPLLSLQEDEARQKEHDATVVGSLATSPISSREMSTDSFAAAGGFEVLSSSSVRRAAGGGGGGLLGETALGSEGAAALGDIGAVGSATSSLRRAKKGSRVVKSVWELKVRLARDIACGIRYIHSLDLAHRDLKSGNVLVSQLLRAKITDFGSIRACFARSMTSSGDNASELRTMSQQSLELSMTAGVGTPLYMAPEALTRSTYDAFKADVFSFGVLLWELYMQQRPDLLLQHRPNHHGPPGPAMLQLLEDGARLEFGDREQGLAAWYKEVYNRCVSSDPALRPTFADIFRIFEQQDHLLAHEARRLYRSPTMPSPQTAAEAAAQGAPAQAIKAVEQAPSATDPSTPLAPELPPPSSAA